MSAVEPWEPLEPVAEQMRAEHFDRIAGAESRSPDRVSEPGDGERLFTQEEVNGIIAKRVAGMPTKREMSQARGDIEMWRNRAMRNRGEVIALERLLDERRSHR